MQMCADVIAEKDKRIADLEAKLAESEKKHLLDEKEWQDYCAFKHIEPQIKGCLDRERECEKKLAEKDKRIHEVENTFNVSAIALAEKFKKIKELKQQLAEKEIDLSLARNEIDTLKHNLNISQEHDKVMCEQYFEKCKESDQDKISFAVERLSQFKSELVNKVSPVNLSYTEYVQEVFNKLNDQIKQLKENK